MKADEGFIELLRELLEPLGRVGMRRMFGGYGVYVDQLFIAIVIEGNLYLKVDGETRGKFEAAGSAPFVYQGKDKPVEMSYWSVPEEALDSADDMRPWARMAIAAALRKPITAKAPRKKRTKAAG